MKEELIRVENGRFQNNGSDCRFELSISRGECIGIYVDEHLTSGTAYLDIFKGASHVTGGRVFVCGQRTGSIEMEHWIEQHCMVADRSRFVSKELTVWDFVMALGKPLPWRQRRQAEVRLRAPETLRMLRQMELDIPWQAKLTGLSLLDYYRMAVFRAWFCGIELLVLDRFTEILRHRDLEQLMRCVQLLLERGTAVLLLDMSEEFLYRYAGRIDVIRDRCTCYRLYPDEYDGRLFEILGWDRRSRSVEHLTVPCGEQVVMDAMGLTFPGLPPLTFQIRSGEIALLRDENYNTVSRIQDCFLGGRSWVHGAFRLDGQTYTYRELMRLTGTRIGIQIERPDRPYGVLFDDLTALDNLCIGLLPKAGHHIVRRRVTEMSTPSHPLQPVPQELSDALHFCCGDPNQGFQTSARHIRPDTGGSRCSDPESHQSDRHTGREIPRSYRTAALPFPFQQKLHTARQLFQSPMPQIFR